MTGKKKIVFSYVAAELALIISECCVFWKETDWLTILLLSSILMLSAVILVIDTRCHIIPNLCLFPMLLLTLGYLIRSHGDNSLVVLFGNSVVSMIMMCFILMTLTTMLKFRGALGAGDIKYASVAAFLFGLSARIVPMLIWMTASMLLYVLPMILAKKMTFKSMIAFGPFIAIGVMGGICGIYIPLF